MLSIRANHNPIQNRHSKYAEHTGNESYRTLSIRGTHFIAGWAYAEWISSLAEYKRKFLKVEYIGRIEYDFQKSRVTGPWDHKVSVSAKKSHTKISCLCTFKLHNTPLIQARRISQLSCTQHEKWIFSAGGVTTSFPQSATRGYHAGSVLAMEDEYQASAISIDMNGAVQSYMQVSSFNLLICKCRGWVLLSPVGFSSLRCSEAFRQIYQKLPNKFSLCIR